MKCKQDRQKEKERFELRKELKELNPQLGLYTQEDKIYVSTNALWQIIIPKDWKIIFGKSRSEVYTYGCMAIRKNEQIVYIYSSFFSGMVRFN